jgi:GT2 family glycosyltransferase
MNNQEINELIKSKQQLEKKLAEQTIRLERINNDLNRILSSKSYKIYLKIFSLYKKYFPSDSNRNHLLKFFLKPFLYFLSRKVDYKEYQTSFSYIELNDTIHNTINDYEPITFNKTDNPLVSIIIPVYNQVNYTYNCLKSISENTEYEINYEIIIADDCSNDLTVQIAQIITNIKIIKTNDNLKFLKNCNNAAKYAKGKYILFLNNDTQVQKNWLSSLLELIEKDNTIGAVGSKLVFKNNMLQEAGGILWSNGRACNYGRMNYPLLPEYNYVKEVDYISGASLMIRKEIWDKLGGFDEIYTPAYYEDADICFSVRKLGFKVVYQSASIVVHFEGITNGTDLTTGQKQYQIINQNKFYEKWKDTLEKEHFIDDKNIFLARDRSRTKKTILIIDIFVPFFDKYAGSRTIFQYLKYFVELGFNVKFIGNDYIYHEYYTPVLEQLGIEVLYGPYYAQNYETWLKKYGKYIDFVILSRPNIAEIYLNKIKKYTKAKILYFGIDLHFLRESREYEVKKDPNLLISSKKYKKTELSIIKKSDASYFYSTVEVELIKNIYPKINCKVIPLYIYDKYELKTFDFNNRKNLLFVGGFQHFPNIDGVIWFVNEIMPILRKTIPGITLNIIGSNMSDEILKLEKNDIKILGHISDEELDKYYTQCRIFVAPLRFGAGVKGKIIESMFKQIPVVTTTIGAEGLPEIEDCIVIEDDPASFADKLINLYNNEILINKLLLNSYNYIQTNFTKDKLKRIIDEDFIKRRN